MTASMHGFPVKSELAYTVVRDRILSHEYEPGATFNQARLAVEMGISTTPLREALRRLQSEGLVELGPHRDATVTALSLEEARDLLELRLAVDPLAASLAAQRRTREDIAAIRAASSIEPLPSRPTVAQLVDHRRFHRAVYLACHNELLIATLDSLWDKADRYRTEALREDRGDEDRRRRDAEHRELMLSVISGDADGAGEVMRRHITSSLGALAAKRLGEASDATIREGDHE